MKTLTRVKSRKSRKNRLNRELRKELGKKLLGYSVAAGAVLTIGTGVAEAIAIKTTLGTPEVIGLGDFFNLDIDGDGNKDVFFHAFSTTFTSTYTYTYTSNSTTYTYNYNYNYAYNIALAAGGSYSIFGPPINPNSNQVVASTSQAAQNLSLLSPINATLLSNSGTAGIALLGSYGFGNFLDSRGFLGVEFDISSNTHYGWVDIGLNADASEITIYGWGYEEDLNVASIQAGAGSESQPVPEPATLVTLAMGAAGLYAWRRGRKRKGLKNTAQKETQNV